MRSVKLLGLLVLLDIFFNTFGFACALKCTFRREKKTNKRENDRYADRKSYYYYYVFFTHCTNAIKIIIDRKVKSQLTQIFYFFVRRKQETQKYIQTE